MQKRRVTSLQMSRVAVVFHVAVSRFRAEIPSDEISNNNNNNNDLYNDLYAAIYHARAVTEAFAQSKQLNKTGDFVSKRFCF